MTTETTDRIGSFAEFWPYYLGEHRQRKCRALHYAGTVFSFLLLVAIIVTGRWAWIWLVLVAGYGPAWVGHFFIEHNRPATFKYPLWSFLADYKMLYLACKGEIGAELSRHFGRASNPTKTDRD